MKTVSIEAEQSVIGSILLDTNLIDSVCEVIGADDFYQSEHRDIFRSVLEMRATSTPVDHVSLSEHMDANGRNGSLSYLVELSNDTPGTTNTMVYAGIVRDRSKKRALQSALDLASRSIVDDSASDADELTARAAALIGGLQATEGGGVRNTREVLKSLSQKWDRRSKLGDTIDGLETGIKFLDDRYMGWKPGDLIVVAGRPGMGKSVFAFQVGQFNAVRRNKRVMGFSVEMPAEQVMQRMTANQSGVHLDVFRRCDPNDFGRHSQEITSAAGILANTELLLDDTPMIHINQIMARARAAHRRAPLDLVIVDHINIVRADASSRERELATISGNLKGLAKELGCPVIAVTQLNRDVEKRKPAVPMMSDLRDSGSIEQDADIVVLLYREEYYSENTDRKGIIDVITGKFREGETGTDYCASLLHLAKIGNLDYHYQPREKQPEARSGLD